EDAHDDDVAVPLAVASRVAKAPLGHEAKVLVERLRAGIEREHVESDAVQAERVEGEREHELDCLGAVPAPPVGGPHREAQVRGTRDAIEVVEHDLAEVLVRASCRHGHVDPPDGAGDARAPLVDLGARELARRAGESTPFGIGDRLPHRVSVVGPHGPQADELSLECLDDHVWLLRAARTDAGGSSRASSQACATRSRMSSRTRPASAWPRVAFMTAPMIAPTGPWFPPRTFSMTSGCAASASSIAARRGPSSETTSSPRATTTSSGEPSPASTPSSTWRASLSLMRPASTSACSSPTWAGVTGSSSSETPCTLAVRASSPIHHLRAAAGAAPAAIVASMISTALALTTSRISASAKPHSPRSRRRRAAGSSGSEARISSTHSRLGASGTRSGS